MTSSIPLVPPKPKAYLSNKVLMEHVLESKKQGQMTNDLARSLSLLVERYAKKGNWVGYTYNDDMRGYAMLMLVRTWNGFNPAKSSNPFAFFTQCIKNSFIQYLNQEKRQRTVRDELLIGQGLNPSSGYSDGREHGSCDDEQDFDAMKDVAMELRKIEAVFNDPIERDEIGEIITITDDADEPAAETV